MTDVPAQITLTESLGNHPYPLFAFELGHLTIVAANEAMSAFAAKSLDELEGSSITELVTPEDRGAAEASTRLLASGAIESYRAVRHFRTGDSAAATVWVQRKAINGTPYGLASIETPTATVSLPLFNPSTTVALALTNHDWTIEQVSSEIEKILGRTPASLKGSPLLGLFHPDDVPNFLLAVDRIVADGGSATLRNRARATDRWQDVCCLVVTMCDHSPPRLGVAITEAPDLETEETLDLHRQLALLGHVVFGGVDQLRSPLPSAKLSRRQWEVLTHLARGESVHEIAASLYLSPSTVRNHLTAIYKKFGVHSQAGLMAKLFASLGPL